MFDMDIVAPGDIVDEEEEEEEETTNHSKRDLSPEKEVDSRKKVARGPVWYGERL